MSTVAIPHSQATLMATGALAAFQRKLKGLPESNEEILNEKIHIAQKGVFPSGVLASDAQIIEAKGFLREENMRRGLKKCVETCEEFIEFLKLGAGTHVADEPVITKETTVNLSFNDYGFLTKAATVKAEDFR